MIAPDQKLIIWLYMTKFNSSFEERLLDLVVKEGTVVNPKFTAGGQSRQGDVILTGSGAVRRNPNSENEDC